MTTHARGGVLDTRPALLRRARRVRALSQRITPGQIALAFAHHASRDRPTDFD